jgi:hypothetical protein
VVIKLYNESMHKLANAFLFQVGWFLCASSVQYDSEMTALLCCALLCCIHFKQSINRVQELCVSTALILVGIVVDSSLQQFQIIDFYGWHFSILSPFWDWMIWLMFALTLRGSLAFLTKMSWVAQAFIGLVFSPLSYIAGAKLGAAHFDPNISNVSAIGLTWMLLLPCIFRMQEWIHLQIEQPKTI